MAATGRNEILVGDCIDTMRGLPAGIVQCVVTSPPYWGLRDYKIPPRTWGDGSVCCFGSEPTPDLFVQHAVELFREVRRIMRDDGTLWLNLGDSYASGKGTCFNPGGGATSLGKDRKAAGAHPLDRGNKSDLQQWGLKSGDLCNMPHRVAEALQADGWYWRSTIVWAKRSPMPESICGVRWVPCRVKVAGCGASNSRGQQAGLVTDLSKRGRNPDSSRNPELQAKWEPCPGCEKCEGNGGLVLRRGKWRPTTAHEYIFLFSKSERYFADGEAVQERSTLHSSDYNPDGTAKRKSFRRGGCGGKNILPGREPFRAIAETRNPRSVWTLSSEPYKGAHFATFPSEIPRRCIMAGTSASGCCPNCGACYAPIVESGRVPTRPGNDSKVSDFRNSSRYLDHVAERDNGADVVGNRDPQRHIAVRRTTGHRATCTCNAGEPAPCLVFDPFGGSGTTAQVARHLGRDWLICELNPAYIELAMARIEKPPGFARSRKPARNRTARAELQGVLFVEDAHEEAAATDN